MWGDAFETITVPVVGGSPISVRRRRLLLTLPVTLTIRSLDNVIANTGEALVVTIDIRLHVDMVHRPDGKDYVRVEFDGVGHRAGNDPAIEGLIRTELAGTNVGREVEFEYTAAVLRAVTAMGGGGQVPTVAWSGMALNPDRQAVELRVEVTFDNATGTAFPDEWQRFLTRQADDFRTGHDWAVEITRAAPRRDGHRRRPRPGEQPERVRPGRRRTVCGVAARLPRVPHDVHRRDHRCVQLLRVRHRPQRVGSGDTVDNIPGSELDEKLRRSDS